MMRCVLMKTLLVFLLVFLQSCSGIKLLTPEQIYDKDFLARIDGIKAVYKGGDASKALTQLNQMNDMEMGPAERAVKYNLVGLIHYSSSEFEVAAENFEKALKTADKDRALQSKIRLNLASSYFKLNEFQKAYDASSGVEDIALSKSEAKSFYQLRYLLAAQLQHHDVVVLSIIKLTEGMQSFRDIDDSQFREALLGSFDKLNPSERLMILEKNDEEKTITIPYLARLEIMNRFYGGERSSATGILSWVDRRFSHYEDVKDFLEDFAFRMENYSKVDIGAVGIVVPMSGKNKQYGERAIKGIDTLINKEENKSLGTNLFIKDSQDNPIVAAKSVRELIEKHHVSMIIGGFFPNTAKEEYLEARKYGVFFISLSPVFLDKELKSHLLIEIPGSVQSQIDSLISGKIIEAFGPRVAIFYPGDEGGQSYINELWRRHQTDKIELTSVHQFDKNIKDYREPVTRALGLKFTRERQEELEVWKDVYKLEGKSSIRRIQTLKPIVDFDWVFLPTYPHEAIQIIPAFNYYDATGLKYVGGPSWMSRSLVREQRHLGGLYFVGDDPKDFDPSFAEDYKARYGTTPKLIETLAYEAMNVGLEVIKKTKAGNREELESNVLSLNGIEGVTGEWVLKEGIWMKNMDILRISRGAINKVELSPKEEENVE